MCMNYNSLSYLPTQAAAYSSNNSNSYDLESVVYSSFSDNSPAVEITAYAASAKSSSATSIYAGNHNNNNNATISDIKISYENTLHKSINYLFAQQPLYFHNYQTQFTQNIHSGYYIVDNFLNKHRPMTQFIDEVDQIKDYIKSAFQKTTGYELPVDISIKLCSNEELKKIHESFGGRWEDSIRGFSINNTRQIFVKRSDLDKVMLVIGHEIGHVLSHSLPDKKNEEAKAFAFEIAWMKTIVEQNIANLKDNIAIDFTPAKNGLHDISFNFVRKIISAGKRALDVYWGLMYGIIEVNTIYY